MKQQKRQFSSFADYIKYSKMVNECRTAEYIRQLAYDHEMRPYCSDMPCWGRVDPVKIPDGKQLYRSTCEPLPPGSDFRDCAFLIETKHLTRDEMITLGFLPANNEYNDK